MAAHAPTVAGQQASPLSRLGALLGVEPGEGTLVGGLAALYGILMLGVVFVQAIAFAVFISEFGVTSLPYSYISIAVLASLSAFGFLKLAQRVTFRANLLANVAFLVAGCAIFWVGLHSPLARWTIFLLPAWFQTQINTVNLVVWPLASRLLDVRQARRLLGLVGAGNWIANIIGGFIVAPLVTLFGTSQMFLLALICTAAGLWLLWGILRARLPAAASQRTTATARPARTGAQARRAAPTAGPLRAYIRLILAYVFLWWMAFFFLDNIFYAQAAAQYPDPAALAGATGLLLSAVGVVALITSLLFTGFVLRQYGLRTTLLVMPALCGIAMTVLALAGSLGQAGALLFWLAAFAKLINVAWGFSLAQSALVLSYQPVPADQRGPTQTLAEGIIQPFAIGFAGLALLALNTLLGLSSVGLAWFFVGIIALLIGVIILIGRQYPQVLSNALARRQWGGATAAALDQASRELLQKALRNSHPAAAIYALDTIERIDPPAVAEALLTLLAHPAPEVRRVALQRIEPLRLGAATDAVRQALASEREPAVQSAALTTLAALTAPHGLEPLVARLNAPEPQARRGALVGLLRYATGAAQQRAEQTLTSLAQSADPSERVAAAQVLAESGVGRFSNLTLALLVDPQLNVRRAALKAAARVRDPNLWPALVNACATPGTTHLAVWALASVGPATLPVIAQAMARPGLADDHLIALANACPRIKGSEAVRLLEARLERDTSQVRTAILKALSAAGYRAGDPEVVRTQIHNLAARAAWLSAALIDIGDAAAVQPLRTALELALRNLRDQLCFWLSFVYNAPAILRARAALADGSGVRYAYALEILDTQLPNDLKRPALAIAEELAPHERLARLAAIFPQEAQPRAARVQALIDGPAASWLAPWTRACALFAAGSLPLPECLAAIRAAGAAPAPLIADTARWALARLDTHNESEPGMLSTIEKVLFLKTVSVFGRTPEDVLVEVAELLEVVDVPGGEPIFQKGDPGDSLYIIVGGKVRVDDGERLLNYLGERDLFGEMALLDAEPRAASVTTIEPTQLLRLDQDPFYELLDDRPEIATSLIRVLSQHLRARMRDVAELSAQARQLTGAQV